MYELSSLNIELMHKLVLKYRILEFHYNTILPSILESRHISSTLLNSSGHLDRLAYPHTDWCHCHRSGPLYSWGFFHICEFPDCRHESQDKLTNGRRILGFRYNTILPSILESRYISSISPNRINQPYILADLHILNFLCHKIYLMNNVEFPHIYNYKYWNIHLSRTKALRYKVLFLYRNNISHRIQEHSYTWKIFHFCTGH